MNIITLAFYLLAAVATIVALCAGRTETHTWLVLLWIIIAFLERLSKCFVIVEYDEDEEEEEEK